MMGEEQFSTTFERNFSTISFKPLQDKLTNITYFNFSPYKIKRGVFILTIFFISFLVSNENNFD